jgi:hypothetical protein
VRASKHRCRLLTPIKDFRTFERQEIRAVPPRPAHGPLGLLCYKNFAAFLWRIASIGPVLPTPSVFKSFAVNKMPLERHLHTVEVATSKPLTSRCEQPVITQMCVKQLRAMRGMSIFPSERRCLHSPRWNELGLSHLELDLACVSIVGIAEKVRKKFFLKHCYVLRSHRTDHKAQPSGGCMSSNSQFGGVSSVTKGWKT